MTDPVKRLNYFNGQFLRAQDFQDEQGYHLAMRRLHNSSLHTWGITSGLMLSAPSGATRVTVGQGTAIDGQGRELVLPGDAQTKDLSGTGAASTLFVTISYAEAQTNPVSETGATGNTRVQELPTIDTSPTPPSDPSLSLILGCVQIDAKGVVKTIDNGTGANSRRAAGAVGGDLNVVSLTLADPGVASDKWPRLTAATAGRADLAGDLRITGSLQATGPATFGTKVVIGPHSTGDAVLVACGGVRLGSTDANHGLRVVEQGNVVYLQAGCLQADDGNSRTGSLSISRWASTESYLYVDGGSGNVGIGTSSPLSELNIRNDKPGALGPRLTLMNGGGRAGAGAAIDFSGYALDKEVVPPIRVQSIDDGVYSAHLVFSSKEPGNIKNSLAERLRITSAGRLVSPMWRATTVLNQQPGALPLSGSFDSGGGTLVIIFSGSARRSDIGYIEMSLKLDGASIGETCVWTNEKDSHKAFPTNISIQPGVKAGNHTIELDVKGVGTVTDGHDPFNVSVLELPF